MKNILFITLALILLHGKGPDIEAPKEDPKGPNIEAPRNTCERECK